MNHTNIVVVVLIQLIINTVAFADSEWVKLEPALRKVVITGFTRAQSRMPLATEVEGKVSAVYANVGEPIPTSGKFACLDDTFVNLDIQSAQSEVSRHYIDVRYLKKEVARHQQLVRKQTSAVSVLDKLERDLGTARQALAVASVRKKRLEEYKRRHCIKAPVGWQVIDRLIEPGQWVHQGEVLAHIGLYSQLKIPLTLSRYELSALKKNAHHIRLSLTEENIQTIAVIDHISPAFDGKTRKIRVDLLIKKTTPVMQGGMRVELILEVPDSKAGAFIIAKKALEERFEEYWLHRKDGKSIRVKLLSELEHGRVKIIAPELRLGDQFKVL